MIKPVNLSVRSALSPFVDPATGRLTSEALRWLNDNNAAIQYTLNAILQLPEIQQALLDLDTATQAATTAATNAQTAADNAQTAADTTTAASSLANSYPTGLTLSAADAGTDATITVSSHTRVYGNGTSVSVAGGTITGQPYSTTLYVYYDDPARAGGTVTYQATTSDTTAAQAGNRHVVGQVTTPAAAGGPAPGKPVRPPGSGAIP